ncbi:MAG: methanogenesis marker 15 protein [Candidatus Methylarchaceae archaeon HK02M1]|nr:methanogenesis marker 15 protein [Candidatus Methylarchaceae archaeon HK02M1]
MVVKIAQISCGTEYSGFQVEIEKAAEIVGANIFIPEIELDDIRKVEEEIPFIPKSSGLKTMLARAFAIIEGRSKPDGILILTCFRCAEGALTRTIIRKVLQKKTSLPIISHSFTEKTKAGNLLLKMEALVDMIEKGALFGRKRQEGITVGIDSGSTMTKGVIMKDNEVIAHEWVPTTDFGDLAKKVMNSLLSQANISYEKIDAMGITGYGRFPLKKVFSEKVKLAMEEVTVCAKGATYLADRLEGDATIIDIGGSDNKAVTMYNGLPDSFTVGGICAGASGRFLEIAAARLGVKLDEFGELALKGDPSKIKMNSYCIVFGLHDLVSSLALGASKEDAAAASCYSVAEQFYEQQMQEIEVREPIIQIGGTSLIKGLNKALRDLLRVEVIVPPLSQFSGAIGAALLVSGLIE